MILLKNGTYIDWRTLAFSQADLLVEEGLNGKIILHPDQASVPSGIKEIDCARKFITKSFANGHHHVYSALARGMPAPPKSPENFHEILQYVWWRLDKALDLGIIRSCALVTALSCTKNGVTFVIDHHASPNAVEGSLETIAAAFDEVGVGHLLCYEISDRDGLDIASKGLNETAGYLAKWPGLVGLHASFTVGNKSMRNAVNLAEKTGSGIHIHVAEDKYDQDHCEKNFNQRVVTRLFEAGVLQFPGTILGHCLHLDEHERALIAGSPAWVVQNMESNLNNGVGYFNSRDLGQRIMLGTDGMHSDMLRSAKAAYFAGHVTDDIDFAGSYQRFRNVQYYLESNHFSGDGENNLVVLDYDPPTPLTADNFYGHFLFGIESKQIDHVISQGRLIVDKGQVVTVDEAEILAESRIQAKRLWDRMS